MTLHSVWISLALLTAQLPDGVQPYDWALEQMRVAEAHQRTRGSGDIVVAVIDLGYRHHPALDGHLWVNPDPTRGDVHGWDFHDDDASLEYTGRGEDSAYLRNHHVFVAGEVAAVAPECPIMVLRVGYRSHDSWHKAVRYAVDHGARVLILPHGYIHRAADGDVPLFYQGTDFAYPREYPQLRAAYDEAYDRGCLIFKGTADNRGRRAVFAQSAWDMLCAVGSLDRRGAPANIANSADYVEFAAPAGARGTGDPRDSVWGYAADEGHCAFEGGCMASGFAGAAAALVWSQFPELSNDQLRQVLRNTARPVDDPVPQTADRHPLAGYGALDVAAATSLTAEQLCRDVRWSDEAARVHHENDAWVLAGRLHNHGVFDAERAMAVVYTGDPRQPASPEGTLEQPATSLQIRQIGHAIVRVRGLHDAAIEIQLMQPPGDAVWIETYALDRHDAGHVDCRQVSVSMAHADGAASIND